MGLVFFMALVSHVCFSAIIIPWVLGLFVQEGRIGNIGRESRAVLSIWDRTGHDIHGTWIIVQAQGGCLFFKRYITYMALFS